jgi:hypothetical protein
MRLHSAPCLTWQYRVPRHPVPGDGRETELAVGKEGPTKMNTTVSSGNNDSPRERAVDTGALDCLRT